MTRTVLVTGGLGYLGGRITVALAAEGWRVRVTSRTGKAPKDAAWIPAGTEFARLDLEGPAEEFTAAVKGVDAVVHLAALNEIDSAKFPARALAANGIGTQKLIEAAVAAKVRPFVYMSTAHVYGAPLQGTITEETCPVPVHMYAISHRTAEDCIVAAHRKGEVDGVVLRLSNGFGAPTHAGVDRWTLLVNDLCREVTTSKTMTLKSSGLQRRDFIALEDICRGVAFALKLKMKQDESILFNLGGERAMTVLEMTQLIGACAEKELGFKPELRRPEPNPGETAPTLAFRIERMKKLGFELRGEFENEICATLRLCKGN